MSANTVRMGKHAPVRVLGVVGGGGDRVVVECQDTFGRRYTVTVTPQGWLAILGELRLAEALA